jgi:predicted nucleotidyltransferase
MRDSNKEETIFKKYFGELKRDESIIGIALTGSYAREDNDKYSDVDYIIFSNKRPMEAKLREGKFLYEKIIFDSRVTELNSLKQSDWSRDMHFAYLNCKIIYDKDGSVRSFLDKKRYQWECGLTREISLTLVNMSVIFKFSDNWKGLNADSHYFKFLERDDIVSAHRVLNIGFELMLDLLYLINRRPIPDIKNKTRLLFDLAWIPEEINFILAESILVLEKSVVDCERRYELMMECIGILKRYIDENIVLDDDLYTYYLNNR